MTEILKFYDSSKMTTLESKMVIAARGWIGTPFKHQGRLKGIGCDCLGLLMGVAQELDLRGREGLKLTALDSLAYGHFPDEIRLRAGLETALSPAEKLEAGSIVLMRIEGRAQHLGIIGKNKKYFTLIHAYAPHRKVVEHRWSAEWEKKLTAVFRSYNSGLSLQPSAAGGDDLR